MKKSYDYIVVGAGSAGCVIAHRILQHTASSVLLIEAGGHDKSMLVKMPGAVGKVIPVKTWEYTTSPHPNTGNRPMSIAQGKVMGGSSSVNGMIYIRGHKEDYDNWVTEYGCEGWGYEDILPWFLESEGNESLSNKYHSSKGLLKVNENRYRHPLTQAFIRAGQESGLPYVNDFNDNGSSGVGFYQTTTHLGERYSTSKAYLEPHKSNPNLTIISDTVVNRVHIEDDKATGVYCSIRGKPSEFFEAHKEVILSAGAIGTPKILMLSGIGDGEHLKENGIECKKNLPVGYNLQDHLHLSINATLKEPISLYGEDKGLKSFKNGASWLFFRHGLLTSNVLEGGAFIDTEKKGRPDTQIHFLPALDTWDDPNGIGKGRTHGFTLKVGHLQPKSRGRVKLRSKKPEDLLDIDANFLGHPDDLPNQVRALGAGLNFLRMPSLKELYQEAFSPPNARHIIESGGDIEQKSVEDFIRNYCKTTYHPVGTCRMGPSPTSSVVDLGLCVHGVNRLRVIDSSIFPQIPSGNTNAPTIAIAEKAVDIILKGA